MKGKESLDSLDLFLVVLGPSCMALGVYLGAEISWHTPNSGLSFFVLSLNVGPCCESSLLILLLTPGGRWWCDSYFIDEKTEWRG